MRKSGFTLIELLAVIVILAIIALIAVPIVLNIIEDSKKSSQKESINMYAKAIEDGVANYFLKNPGKKEIPTLTQLETEKYINYSGDEVKCEETRIYKTGRIYLGKCSVAGEQVTYTYGEKEKSGYKEYITLETDTGATGLSIGDKYKYKVNDTNTFYFYVLSIKDDKVNLIMDRNICGSATEENASTNGTEATNENPCKIEWHSGANNNNYGPDTAMKGLYNATKNWTNVPNMDLSGENAYIDENNKTDNTKGYTGITTENGVATITGKNNATNTVIGTSAQPLKARLPREDEVFKENDDNYCNYSGGSCPTWLVENLEDAGYSKYSSIPKTSNVYGYWLLSSYPGDSDGARNVSYRGYVDDNITSLASFCGVRAVITVSKSDLS